MLRKENEILRRQVKKPLLKDDDSLFFSAIFSICKDAITNIRIVRPETVVAWHRKLAKKRWDYNNKKRGRPEIDDSIKEMIVDIKMSNPRWGLRKIRGELRKLGIKVCRETIKKVLKERDLWSPPGSRRRGRSWYQFLRDHNDRFFAADFFNIDTIFFQRLYVFFIIEFPSRKIIQFAITTNPTQLWLENVLIAAFPGEAPITNVMVTDRDGIYGEWLTPFLKNILGITRKRTPPRCPFWNAYAS